MNKLINLIRERRLRQPKGYDPILAIFNVFIDPATKKEGDLSRHASLVGGPRLRQEPSESDEDFEARVMAVAHQLRDQNEQIA